MQESFLSERTVFRQLIFRSIFADQIGKLLLRDFLQCLAFDRKIFKGFAKSLCHFFVGVFRPAENGEFLSLRDSFVSIRGIQTQSKEMSHDLRILHRKMRMLISILHGKQFTDET